MRPLQTTMDGVLEVLLAHACLICQLPGARQMVSRLKPIARAEFRAVLNRLFLKASQLVQVGIALLVTVGVSV
ncbi:MAG TPA: hypothetical protein DHV08_07755 [Rhodocyclaceae bacterium]|nr:hypothetical protein [Rhodocyclaceae bacterium]